MNTSRPAHIEYINQINTINLKTNIIIGFLGFISLSIIFSFCFVLYNKSATIDALIALYNMSKFKKTKKQ